MTKEDLKQIQKEISYNFENVDLLQQAFIRKSYSQENGGENNEVLEFIGDKALDFAVMKILMEEFGEIVNPINENYIYGRNRDCVYLNKEFRSKFSEGKFTEIKKNLTQKKMLAHRIDILGYNDLLIMGKGDLQNNVQDDTSVKEDLFEAIIGAVALDSNWDINIIQRVVEIMLNTEAYLNNEIENDNNYTSLVQEWCQREYNVLPNYDFGNNSEGFVCRLQLPENGEFYALAKSKAAARRNAAEQAYNYLEEHNMFFTIKDEIGEIDYERCINQLQELAQKGYISFPYYEFSEGTDQYGSILWLAKCSVDSAFLAREAVSTSKKEAKKEVAYEILNYLVATNGVL